MTPLDGDAAMGKIGLPAPLSELAARDWDAVVVGGGHNGLTAAAYLARAGRSVLVLERQERIGGACTLEQPFPDPRYLISPCAYVVGLLDGLVIRELELERHGYRVLMADPNLWCPLPDGSSVGLFLDRERTAAYLREQRLLGAGHRGPQRLRRAVPAAAPDASHRAARHLGGLLPDPRRAGGAPRPRRRVDLGRVRGVDRRDPRPLHRRRAHQARALRPGRDRRLRRAPRPRHGLGAG